MTNNGDDCYFFYYSNCFKGDSCPFRHCEAALGNETVCNLWQEGRCFRTVCKFRHMEIPKNRKEIPCYWEKQPTGCQKPHCAFFHEKPRYVEGIFVPPDKSQSRNEEQQQQQQQQQPQQEEPAAPPAAPLPTVVANPQLRGVIKTETQELVPSPTHPPVVINPADDDEDEDDQISEEGEDARGGPSPRKHPKLDNSLNFGVSTLEEIRLRKALKASMKRAGYPIQSTQPPANGEKENIQEYYQAPLFEPHYEEGTRPQGSVLERLGRMVPYRDANGVEGLPLKRSLADRLGRVVDLEQPQKSFKPVKARLGLFPGVDPSSQPVENAEVSTKAPQRIRIKTLDEIRREKAAQNQSDITSPAEIVETVPVKGPNGIKRSITVKGTIVSHDKSFSELIHTQKKRQDEDNELSSTSKKAKYEGRRSRESEEAERPVVEVKVKTLEEIRKEKAARIQHATETENKKSPHREDDSTKRLPLLRIRRPPASPADNVPVEKEAAAAQKPSKPGAGGSETKNVKVKSFEEIMREKRLRKQEQQEQQQEEEQARSSAAEESSQSKVTAAGLLNRKFSLTTSTSQVPEQIQPSIRVPSYKKISFAAKSAPNLDDDANAAVTVDQTEQNSSSPSRTDSGSESRKRKSSSSPSPVKRVNNASPAGEEMTASTKRDAPPTRRSTDTKVRPKLNVKPSVMKTSVPLKPAQKRRGAVVSAVAAVKPLSSRTAPSGRMESKQEAAPTDMEAVSSLNGEVKQSSALTSSPSISPSIISSRLGGSASSSAALHSNPLSSLHKEPVKKAPPPQPKSRRSSGATRTTSVCSAGSSSAAPIDDFDDLINEFTDDHLEGDMDPSIGEDDLLQELSDMIDS